MADHKKKILVVGGGIAGITAALEAAEVGHEVILVERNPYLGGRVAQMYHYFPKLCPPSCGLEINYRRLQEKPAHRGAHPGRGGRGHRAGGRLLRAAQGAAALRQRQVHRLRQVRRGLQLEVDNPFNYNMNKMKAAYLPHPNAFPARYVLHPELVGSDRGPEGRRRLRVRGHRPRDKEREETLSVGAIVWATGWEPYDPTEHRVLRLRQEHQNVITNVMMERLAAPDGPTGGKILRPSDGEAPKSVVFVQCAGSRDENHLAYCSGVCCLASLKQATYVREQLPESQGHDLLHRHPHAGPAGGLLRQGAGGRGRDLRQVQDRGHHRERRRGS